VQYPLSNDVLDTGDISIIGQKDAGKTYTAKTIIERQLRKGRRVLAFDPVGGAWCGLQRNPDGTKSDLPIVICG
jgi:DNA helicase HerA-like ATPase